MARHIIQSLEFDISVSSEQEGRELMVSIEDAIKNKLVHTIEQVFDELDLENEVIRAELLEIDLGEISIYELNSEFEFRLRQQLKEILAKLVFQHKEDLEADIEERSKHDEDWLAIFITTGVLPWWMNVSTFIYQSIQEEITKALQDRPRDVWGIILQYYLDDHVQHRFSKYISKEQFSKVYPLPIDSIKTKIQSLFRLFPEFISLQQQVWEAVLSDRSGKDTDEVILQQLYLAVDNKTQETLTKSEWLLWIKIQPQVHALHQDLLNSIETQYQLVKFDSLRFFQTETRFESLDTWLSMKSHTERFHIMRKVFSGSSSTIQRTNTLLALMNRVTSLSTGEVSRLSHHVWRDVMKAVLNTHSSGLKQQVRQIDDVAFSYLSQLADEPKLSLIQLVSQAYESAGPTVDALIEDLDELQSKILHEQEKASFKGTQEDDPMVQVLNFMLFGLTLHDEQRSYVTELLRYFAGVNEEKPKQLNRSRDEYVTHFQKFVRNLTEEEVIFVVERMMKTDLLEDEKSQIAELMLSSHPVVMTLHREVASRTYQFNTENLDQQLTLVLGFYVKYGRSPFQTQGAEEQSVLHHLEQKYPSELREIRVKLSPRVKIQIEELYRELDIPMPSDLETETDESTLGIDDPFDPDVSEEQSLDSSVSDMHESEGHSSSLKPDDNIDEDSLADSYATETEESKMFESQKERERQEGIEGQEGKELEDQEEGEKKRQEALEVEAKRDREKQEEEVQKEKESGKQEKQERQKEKNKVDQEEEERQEDRERQEGKEVEDQKEREKKRKEEQEGLFENDEPKVSRKLEEQAQKALSSSVYIRNAGLILLAPYLSKLFERAGLLDDKKMLVGQRNKIKAIEWLHYLVFGTDQMEEYDSLLSKIITDLPVSVSLPAKISLTDEEKDICNGLLRAVVTNWPALKGSSEDNLRGSFLIREGKLTNEDAQYVLIVEEKGYDLLIDKIPWSFRLINYKWMKKPVFVEWR